MRILFQLVLALIVGLGSLFAGVFNLYSPADVLMTFYSVDISNYSADARLAIETQARLLAGMWLAAGLATFFCLRHFERHGDILRLVTAGLALASLAELGSTIVLQGNVQAALLKCIPSVAIYIFIDVWRARLSRPNQDQPANSEMSDA